MERGILLFPFFKTQLFNNNVKYVFHEYLKRFRNLCFCLHAHEHHLMENDFFEEQIKAAKEKVENTPILVNAISEQKSIAKMLDLKCAQIDSLIVEKESLISDLTEYKNKYNKRLRSTKKIRRDITQNIQILHHRHNNQISPHLFNQHQTLS